MRASQPIIRKANLLTNNLKTITIMIITVLIVTVLILLLSLLLLFKIYLRLIFPFSIFFAIGSNFIRGKVNKNVFTSPGDEYYTIGV